MKPDELLRDFLADPSAPALSDLADELADWPPAASLLRMAARSVYLEDERLEELLGEAVREARRLLEEE